MSSQNNVSNEYGAITISPLSAEEEQMSEVEKLRPVTSDISIYHWQPSDQIAGEVPKKFAFRMLCATGRDAVRRFIIADAGYEAFISNAFCGGLAVLDQIQNLGGEGRFNYRQKFLLFQKVRRLNEHQRRQFRYIKDLSLINSKEKSDKLYGLLPDNIGIAADGTGQRWTIKQLIARGEEHALEFGLENPSSSENIAHGFFAAALLNPVRIESDAEIAGMLRIALYDGGPNVDISKEQRVWIIDRILQAIERHIDNDQDQFDNWFTGPKNTFIREIVRKRCPHGEITQDMVRQVLLDLGWDAYEYVSNCIHHQMKCFQNAIPTPLNAAERKHYGQVYLSQSYWANMPLVLLVERLSHLKVPLLIKMDEENFDLVGVLHQLLSNYSSMIHRRREVDRRSQHVSRSSREGATTTAGDREIDEVSQNTNTDEQNIYQRVASDFREIRNASCNCSTTIDWQMTDPSHDESNHEVQWTDMCATCGHSESVTVPESRFQEIMEREN